MKLSKTYLDILIHERESGLKNGLYDYVTVRMAYDTNKIEGSTLTLSDTKSLYEKNVVPTGGHKYDEITESKNHFKLFDFMLDTIDESLNESLIKEFHQILKKNTTDEEHFGIGRWKKIPNIAGEQKVAEPHQVQEMMEDLLSRYEGEKTLQDVISFHHEFELIHPFQDGNGRVGRILMLRDCLVNDITPFIISSERRNEYIEGLSNYDSKPNLLIQEVTMQQEKFTELASPFLKHHKQSKKDKTRGDQFEM